MVLQLYTIELSIQLSSIQQAILRDKHKISAVQRLKCVFWQKKEE